MTTITRKLGMNKGKRRLWIEGVALSANGFNHGSRYDLSIHRNRIVLIPNTAGKRKIAGKAERPIIDLTGATITSAFADSVTIVTIKRKGVTLVIDGVE